MSSNFSFCDSQPQPTPVRVVGRVPPGHLVASEKWRGTTLVQSLRGKVNIVYENDLGVVDFHPDSETAIVYVSENEMVAGSGYKRKIVKLRKANCMKGIVLAEKTNISQQYFAALQKFVVLDLGMILLYVTSQIEASSLLMEMVNEVNRLHPNPFRSRKQSVPVDQAVLTSVQLIPKVGEVKARALLEKFGSIKGIATASTEEIANIIGRANAEHVKMFLDYKIPR
ncbi:Fanconi anemia core complex-associated protein 24-like [Saccoglossus kowalevskii]|uniref:Fanconi anemia-associated protein of 24 kDa-like n=1 Tax=Saccoglossus kowalevskii TaxID=10224 RepID=A0ABM0GKM3_SACKO|nr:PREDICTED: Fanconi anemia-associated protein of 24 kDa-like [Saccoglossus kowalevskii]